MNDRLEYMDLKDLPVIVLALALSLLAAFNGGLDSNVVYWVLFLLLGLSLYIALKYKGTMIINITNPILWYTLMVFWGGISIFWSLNPHSTLIEFLQLLLYLVVFGLAANISKDHSYRIGKILLVTGVGIALLGIGQCFFVGISRMQGTFSHPNPMAIYLGMILLPAWGVYIRTKSYLVGLSALILMSAILLSGSRGTLLALAIALPVLLYGRNKSDLRGSIVKTILCLLIAYTLAKSIVWAGTALHKDNSLWVRPNNTFVTYSVDGRLTFWKVNMDLIKSNPMIGYGLGTHSQAYYLKYDGSQWYARFAHNHYLQTATEMGIIGLILLMITLLLIAAGIKRRYKQDDYDYLMPGLAAAMLAFVLHIGIDFTWNYPAVTALFFAMAGQVSGVIKGQPKADRAIKVSYKSLSVFLIIFMIITTWKLASAVGYRLAYQADAAGDIKRSIALYERINTFYPISPMAYSILCDSYLTLNKQAGGSGELQKKALDSAIRAVELSPTDAGLQNQLGRVYWGIGKQHEAERHLLFGVKYAAFDLRMFTDAGAFYMYQKQWNKAEKVLLKAQSLEGAVLAGDNGNNQLWARENLYNVHLLLANTYDGLGETDKEKYHLNAAEEERKIAQSLNQEAAE